MLEFLTGAVLGTVVVSLIFIVDNMQLEIANSKLRRRLYNLQSEYERLLCKAPKITTITCV